MQRFAETEQALKNTAMDAKPKEPGAPPRFFCDAMLGGLTRWLRAAGYSTEFDVHAKDGELVRKAFESGKVLVTSDAGVMEYHAVSTGLVRTIFLPVGLSPVEQLGRVLGELNLPLRESRCMDCNGELAPVPLKQVRAQVPAKVVECCREFYVCEGCRKVYWHGTHWRSIGRQLVEALALARGQAGSGQH